MADLLLEFAVPIAAIVLSLWAISVMTRRRLNRDADRRMAAVEEQLRGLLHRVWMLEQQAAGRDAAAPDAGAGIPPHGAPHPGTVPGLSRGDRVDVPLPGAPTAGAAGPPATAAPRLPSPDLE